MRAAESRIRTEPANGKTGICSRDQGIYNAGFTLMEVLIAFSIVSVCFVLIMQLFSGGLRASKTSCDYTKAVVYAKDKMEELDGDPQEGSGEYEDGFTWQTVVQPYNQDEEAAYNLVEVKVIVSWNDVGKSRQVELVSLKVGASEGS